MKHKFETAKMSALDLAKRKEILTYFRLKVFLLKVLPNLTCLIETAHELVIQTG